ncbi:hypothetical protein ACGILN_10225 [Serratia marcescens]|uniref:hypothetical protein n=1 Tax=Serratia marcescens TaxID=615 RepID=UPI0037480EAF
MSQFNLLIMKTQSQLSELTHLAHDIICIGVIVEVKYVPPCCSVQLGGIRLIGCSDWPTLPEVRAHGGPPIGELVLTLGGELDTVFVLRATNYQEDLCGWSNRHSRDVQYDARSLLGFSDTDR